MENVLIVDSVCLHDVADIIDRHREGQCRPSRHTGFCLRKVALLCRYLILTRPPLSLLVCADWSDPGTKVARRFRLCLEAERCRPPSTVLF